MNNNRWEELCSIIVDNCERDGDEALSEHHNRRSARRPSITGLREVSGANADQSTCDQTETDDRSTSHSINQCEREEIGGDLRISIIPDIKRIKCGSPTRGPEPRCLGIVRNQLLDQTVGEPYNHKYINLIVLKYIIYGVNTS